VPVQITTNATSPAGVVVNYAVTATDPDDAVSSLTCTPGSGSTFPIGTTTVTCVATDTNDNTSTAGFTVHVKGAAEQLADLAAAVVGVGPGTSLRNNVNRAQAYVAAKNVRAACLTLTVFVSEVNAVSGLTIPQAQAAALTESAKRIKNVLGC
jgi:hypothetical protein